MSEKARLLTSKDVQKLLRTVKRDLFEADDCDCINWNNYETVPVHDPENKNLVTLRNNYGVVNYLLWQQQHERKSCDTLVRCDGGYIPCHSHVLMHWSPLLKRLISANLREIGKPSYENPIHLTFYDYNVRPMIEVFGLFYTGFCNFSISLGYEIREILKYLEVENIPSNEKYKKADGWAKGLIYLVDISRDDDEDEKPIETNNKVKNQVDDKILKNDEPQNQGTEQEQQSPMVETGSGSSKIMPENTESSEKSQTIPLTKDDEEVARPKDKIDITKETPESQIVNQENMMPKTPEARDQRSPIPTLTIKRVRKTWRQRNSTSAKPTTKSSTSTSSSVSSRRKSSGAKEQPKPAAEEHCAELDQEVNPPITCNNSEQEGGSDSAMSELDGDELHFYERQLRSSKRKSKEKRNPPDVSTNEQDNLDNESNSSSKTVKVKELKFYKRCKFCEKNFKTEDELIEHTLVTSECANFLRGMYNFKTRMCFICKMSYIDSLSRYGFILHVYACHSNGPKPTTSKDEADDQIGEKSVTGFTEKDSMDSRKRKISDLDSNISQQDRQRKKVHAEEISPNEESQQSIPTLATLPTGTGSNSPPEPPPDDEMQTDTTDSEVEILECEKIPYGLPVVILGKLENKTINELAEQIRKGYTQDIPRVPGYTYVQLAPKIEPPDEILDQLGHSDDLVETIRQYEREQRESELESELRQQTRKEQEQRCKEKLDKNQIMSRLRTNCSCSKSHYSVGWAIECMKERGLQICLICCTEFSTNIPIENHIQRFHSDKNNEKSVCPICNLSFVFEEISGHIMNHLENCDPVSKSSVTPSKLSTADTGKSPSLISNKSSSSNQSRRQKNRLKPPTTKGTQGNLVSQLPSIPADVTRNEATEKWLQKTYTAIPQTPPVSTPQVTETTNASNLTTGPAHRTAQNHTQVPSKSKKSPIPLNKDNRPASETLKTRPIQISATHIPSHANNSNTTSDPNSIPTGNTTISTASSNNANGSESPKTQPTQIITTSNSSSPNNATTQFSTLTPCKSPQPLQAETTMTLPSKNTNCLDSETQPSQVSIQEPETTKTQPQIPNQLPAIESTNLVNPNVPNTADDLVSETPNPQRTQVLTTLTVPSANFNLTTLKNMSTTSASRVLQFSSVSSDMVQRDPLITESALSSRNIPRPEETNNQRTETTERTPTVTSVANQREQPVTTGTTQNKIPSTEGRENISSIRQTVTNHHGAAEKRQHVSQPQQIAMPNMPITVYRVITEKQLQMQPDGKLNSSISRIQPVVATNICESQPPQQNNIAPSQINAHLFSQNAPNGSNLTARPMRSPVQDIQGDHYIGGIIQSTSTPLILRRPGRINIPSIGTHNQLIQNVSRTQSNVNHRHSPTRNEIPISNIRMQTQGTNLQSASTNNYNALRETLTVSRQAIRQPLIPGYQINQMAHGRQQYESITPPLSENELSIDQQHLNQESSAQFTPILMQMPVQQQTEQINNSHNGPMNPSFLSHQNLQQPQSMINRQFPNPIPSWPPNMNMLVTSSMQPFYGEQQNNNSSTMAKVLICPQCELKFRTQSMLEDHLCH